MPLNDMRADGWVTAADAAEILGVRRVRAEELMEAASVKTTEYVARERVRARRLYWRADVSKIHRKQEEAPGLVPSEGNVWEAIQLLRTEVAALRKGAVSKDDIAKIRSEMRDSFQHLADVLVKALERVLGVDVADQAREDLVVSDEFTDGEEE